MGTMYVQVDSSVHLTTLYLHVVVYNLIVDIISYLCSPKNLPKPKGHVIATRITSENPDEVSNMIA